MLWSGFCAQRRRLTIAYTVSIFSLAIVDLFLGLLDSDVFKMSPNKAKQYVHFVGVFKNLKCGRGTGLNWQAKAETTIFCLSCNFNKDTRALRVKLKPYQDHLPVHHSSKHKNNINKKQCATPSIPPYGDYASVL